jgi:uncharacterized protein YjbI with pentapeptide repeats
MKIYNGTSLMLGWLVGKGGAPLQWAATFLLKGTFSFRPGAPAVWAEEPRHLSGDLYADGDPAKDLLYPSDFAPLKPRADVLIAGAACAPGGRPVAAVPVAFQVGALAKRLIVFGERRWMGTAVGPAGTTAPEPFTSLLLSFRHSFGGPGYLRNPLGRGWKSAAAPLVEDPGRLARGPGDDAEPAGFGPLPATWPARAGLRGTYGGKWLKSRWPWFPEDFDWSYFNAAPRDQQVEGYFAGDEDMEFQNLHPEAPRFHSKLPGVRPRCFVIDRTSNGDERFREVPLRLDTVWADVTAQILVLVWRGHLDVRTIKLKEVESISVALESMADEPNPAHVYRQALATAEASSEPRLESGAVTQETALELGPSALDKRMAAMERDFAAFEKEMAAARAQTDSELARRKASVLSSGIDPSLFDQAPEETTAIAALDRVLVELRNTDPAAAARVELHRPWISKAEGELAALDGEMRRMQLEMEVDRAAMEADRPKRWTRELVAEAAEAGRGLAGENLAELDLSGLALTRLDLRDAVLVRANLSGCNLHGSDLSGSSLTEADLAGADLSFVKFDGADLTGAKVAGATFVGVSLAAATLAGLDLAGVDLTSCDAYRANFGGANLAGAKLDQAQLTQADFTGAILDGARLTGATLRAAQFEGVKAKGINCEDADLTGLHASGGSDFTGSNFKHVRSEGAIFSEAILDAADFSAASLAKAQFGDASLRAAIFDRADLRGALFDDAILNKASLTKANLLGAAFDRADLTGTDCRGANFYEGGFWDAVTERADFRDANLRGTLLSE